MIVIIVKVKWFDQLNDLIRFQLMGMKSRHVRISVFPYTARPSSRCTGHQFEKRVTVYKKIPEFRVSLIPPSMFLEVVLCSVADISPNGLDLEIFFPLFSIDLVSTFYVPSSICLRYCGTKTVSSITWLPLPLLQVPPLVVGPRWVSLALQFAMVLVVPVVEVLLEVLALVVVLVKSLIGL